jgi:cyclophilin family peptidyl-prolyl cis-trans isomerase/HEAT repeat protein
MVKQFQYLILCFALSLYACIPPNQEKAIDTDIAMDFSDPTIQKLYTLQDKLATDSLIRYFNAENPTHRYIAAMAMGSIKDMKALMRLEQLLNDPVDEVRIAAAFSIGQIGDSSSTTALVKAFQRLDTLRKFEKFNATILEAIGKVASIKYLKNLATISSYKSTDTLLLEGQAKGIYHFMLRDMTASEGTQKMITYACDSKIPSETRVVAANYLARAKDIGIDSAASTKISAIMASDSDYRIRMTLAKALSKANTNVALYALINQLGRDNDYRVRVACVNSLGKFSYAEVSPVIRNYLFSQNLHIARAAAQFYIEHGLATEAATNYWLLAKDTTMHPQVQLMMYQATNKHVSPFMQNTKGIINAEIIRKFNMANSPVLQVAALKALGEYGWNFRFIKEQGLQMQSPLVRSATVEILGDICRKPDFYRIFGSGATKVRVELYTAMLEVLQIGDPGMTAVASEVLRIPAMGFKYFYLKMLDKTFLTNAQHRLKLPKDIETWNALQETIDYFNGVPIPTPKKIPEYNEPIDWKLLNSYGQNLTATIQTKYGAIIVDLYKNKAPGTVVNFIQLANNNFYNGKTFHRVASNFVIQGGCPRGDGYGALDYTIRSEFLPISWNQEGYLGMASSGPHTEGTQFFINNAPAFHLDGKYTIFGKVKSGIEIIHAIQQGDIIEKVTVK